MALFKKTDVPEIIESDEARAHREHLTRNFTIEVIPMKNLETAREHLPAESFAFPAGADATWAWWAWPIATSPAAGSAASEPLPWRFDQIDAAPVLVFPEQTNAASAACCKPMSMVKRRSTPAWAGCSRSDSWRITRERASTSI